MNFGGVQSSLINFYRHIDRSKVQFDFLLGIDKECKHSEEIRRLGGRIYYVTHPAEGFFEHRKAVDVFFREHKEYSVVHSHDNLALAYILKSAKKHGIPVRIIHGRGSGFHYSNKIKTLVFNCLFNWNRLFLKSRATHTLAVSKLAARWIAGGNKYKKNEYMLLYNGVDTERFRYNKEKRREMRREFGLEGCFVIGCVAALNPGKNQEFLIDVFCKVALARDDARLVLVGDGIGRGKIERKIANLNLGDKVFLVGVRQNIPDFLSMFDTLLLASLYEGLPNVIIEAQASGLKCFLSDRVTTEANVTGTVEYLPIDKGPEIWADAIINTPIADDCEKRYNFNRMVAERGFDVRNQSKILENFYINCQQKNEKVMYNLDYERITKKKK
jgi:glycosyltransferase involved in cell wall biosynthesis